MYSVAPGLKGSIGLFALAGLFCALGSVALIEQYRFEHGAVRTQGRVVEHQSRTALNKHKRPYQQLIDVYELTTEAGTTVRFEEELHGIREHAPIGQSAVVYHPSNAPDHARLAGKSSSLGWTFVGIGMVCGALTFANLRRPSVPIQPNAQRNREKAARRSHRNRKKQRSAR